MKTPVFSVFAVRSISRFAFHLVDVRLDLLRACSGDVSVCDQRMLGRHHHVGRAEERVRPRRKNLQRMLGAVRGDGRERHFRAFGSADPVALHRLDLFGPVELLESVEQAIRILRDAQHPLVQFLLGDFGAAAFAAAVDDVFIGDSGFATRTPVDRHVGLVGETALEHLHEDPLRPFVVVRIGRVDLARPVVHRADLVQLAFEIFDVAARADGRDECLS